MIILMTALPLVGCGQDKGAAAPRPSTGQQTTVNSVLEARTATEQPTAAPTAAPKATKAPTVTAAPKAKVDIDLAALSSTMVYSEVYAMMEHPQEYVGKTMRMHGIFACSEGNVYYFCVIQDATACCGQGIEFILAGNPTYPEGYPKLGTEFTVVGVFEDYKEGEYTYYHLRDAVLEG